MIRNVFLLFMLCLFVSNSLFAQSPVNDACADAIAIGDTVDMPFSTINATTDGPLHLNSPCPGNPDPQLDFIYHDIWYEYTPDFTGTAEFDLCQTADYDSKIAVYMPGSSCPPVDSNLLTCNEDGPNCNNFASYLTFGVDSGMVYLLRIGGYGLNADTAFSGSGTFTVREFIPAVANDFCNAAIPITEGTDIPITNVGAITDGPDHPNAACVGFGDNGIQTDVWFTFTATRDGTIEWSTCDMVSFDSRIGVYKPGTSCPPVDEDLLACNDDGAGCSDYSSLLLFDVLDGETYLLRLGGWQGDQGSGTMSFQYTTPPEPPANNLCVDADSIYISTVADAGDFYVFWEGTTKDATFDFNTFTYPSCLANTGGGEFAEVWYKFNNQGISDLEIRFGVATQDASFFVDVWEDCNGAVDPALIPNSCFYVDGTSTALVTDTLGPLATTPTEYYLRVVTRLTSDLPGDFFIQLVSDDIQTSNKEVSPTKSLAVYPNPVQDNLRVKMDLKEAGHTQYHIVNTLGQVMQQADAGYLNAGYNQLDVPANRLANGVYFLVLSSEGKSTTVRFIKQ
jgi:hypothetical protein